MADDKKDPKKEPRTVAQIARNLTSPGYPIFQFDNSMFYSKGSEFRELDGIRDLRLPDIMVKVAKNLEAGRAADSKLSKAEIATYEQGKKLLKHAQKGTDATRNAKDGKPKLDLDAPIARYIVTGDAYRDAAKHNEAADLYTYALQQASLLEKDLLKNPKVKRADTMTGQIEEYIDAMRTDSTLTREFRDLLPATLQSAELRANPNLPRGEKEEPKEMPKAQPKDEPKNQGKPAETGNNPGQKTTKEKLEAARKTVGDLAAKLTGVESAIFAYDDKRFYKEGKVFEELDPIRDHKLTAVVSKNLNNKELNQAEKAILLQAVNLLAKADKSYSTNEKLKLEDRKLDLDVPLARIVEAANQYRTAGDTTLSNMLYRYAASQAEIIEANEKEKPITTQLKTYIKAVEDMNKLEAELKAEQKKQSSTGKPPRASANPQFEKLLVNLSEVKLGANNNTPLDAALLAAKKANSVG